MAVAATDLKYYKSTNGDSAGGVISAVEIVAGVKNNLWSDITEAERLAAGTRYRKWFLANEHATDALVRPVFWLSVTPLGLVESLGLGFSDADDDNSDAGNMTAFAANAVVGLVSDGADTRTATVYGLDGTGVPITESVVLAGATEVLTTATFSKVWAVKMDAESASRVVTVRQGAGGVTRGTVQLNRESCFLWVVATSEGAGIKLPNLIAGGNYGFWDRQEWSAGLAANRPVTSEVVVKET